MAPKAKRAGGKKKVPVRRKAPPTPRTPSKPRASAKAPPRPWATFRDSLAAVLGALGEDQFLVISSKREPWFVQFAAQGKDGMRAEALSDSYVGEAARLSKAQFAGLVRMGWLAPTGGPAEATPEKQPDGSPNFFRDYPRPVPFADVASLATDTLARIYGIGKPSDLEYQAFEGGGTPVLLPTLGLAVHAEAPKAQKGTEGPKGEGRDFDSVKEIARKVVRAGMKDETLDYDGDGDLVARFGSAVAYVRPIQDPLAVRVFSPVVSGIEESTELKEKLNDLNGRVPFARFLVNEGTVFAAVDVPAAPLLAEHLDQAIMFLGQMADDMDDQFQKDFGGRTATGEFRPPPARRTMGFRV